MAVFSSEGVRTEADGGSEVSYSSRKQRGMRWGRRGRKKVAGVGAHREANNGGGSGVDFRWSGGGSDSRGG
jgi:hypothetical protein